MCLLNWYKVVKSNYRSDSRQGVPRPALELLERCGSPPARAPRAPARVRVRVGRTSGAPAPARTSHLQPARHGLRSQRSRCRCRLGFRQLEAIPNAMFTFGSDERLSPTPTRRAAHLPPRCSPSERAPAESSLRALARSFAPHSCRRSLGQRLRTGRREIQHRQAAG